MAGRAAVVAVVMVAVRLVKIRRMGECAKEKKMKRNDTKKSVCRSKQSGGKFSTTQIARMALMVAFISVASYVRIPTPFSENAITGQTLAMNVIALLLPSIEVLVIMVVYWLLGVVGLPVYGGSAGPGKMFGPAGGYFVAFILAGLLIAKLRGRKYHFVRYLVVAIGIGIPVVNGIGMVWMKLLTGISWKVAFSTGFLLFLPMDILKCVVAVLLVKPLKKGLESEYTN